MSLQSLWSLYSLDPARVLNLLALFFSAAGGWLLLATRWREQGGFGLSRGASTGGGHTMVCSEDKAAALNRFFYGFGGASLAAGLGISLASAWL